MMENIQQPQEYHFGEIKKHSTTLNCWINIGNTTIKEERWRIVLACIWWTVWKERNQRCFEGKKNNLQNFKMNCIALYYFWCKQKVLVQVEELFDVIDYL